MRGHPVRAAESVRLCSSHSAFSTVRVPRLLLTDVSVVLRGLRGGSGRMGAYGASVPGTHAIERQNQLPRVLLWLPHRAGGE